MDILGHEGPDWRWRAFDLSGHCTAYNMSDAKLYLAYSRDMIFVHQEETRINKWFSIVFTMFHAVCLHGAAAAALIYCACFPSSAAVYSAPRPLIGCVDNLASQRPPPDNPVSTSLYTIRLQIPHTLLSIPPVRPLPSTPPQKQPAPPNRLAPTRSPRASPPPRIDSTSHPFLAPRA